MTSFVLKELIKIAEKTMEQSAEDNEKLKKQTKEEMLELPIYWTFQAQSKEKVCTDTNNGPCGVSAELLPQHSIAVCRLSLLVLPNLLICNSIIHQRNSQQTQIEWITSQPLRLLLLLLCPTKKFLVSTKAKKRHQLCKGNGYPYQP